MSLLSLDNRAADIPIEAKQFAVARHDSAQPCAAYTNFQISENFLISGRQAKGVHTYKYVLPTELVPFSTLVITRSFPNVFKQILQIRRPPLFADESDGLGLQAGLLGHRGHLALTLELRGAFAEVTVLRHPAVV